MNQASQNRLYQDVDFLTSIRPYRNFLNLAALAETTDYIKTEFQKAGFVSSEQKWMAQGEEYANVIVQYQPEKSSRLIVGAHYDVCGDQAGADDNASAVAGLLEMARLVGLNQPKLDFGIDFVAYCLEEPPFFATEYMGSYVHAESLRNAGTDVLGMICLEMIGYFSDEPGSQTFPIPELAQYYPDTGDFIIVVGLAAYKDFHQRFYKAMKKGAKIDVQEIAFPSSEGLAGLSDHRNYWEFGFPAVMINDTSFLRNPNYHEESDTIDTLNFEKMKAVVDAAYQGILRLKNQ